MKLTMGLTATICALIVAQGACAGEDEPEHNLGDPGLSLKVAVDGKVYDIEYVIKADGDAIFEGDIILGTDDDLEKRSAGGTQTMALDDIGLYGLFRKGNYLWPKGYVTYVIDPGLANPNRVRQAVAHWEGRTQIRFAEKASATGNYIHFVTDPKGGCSSSIGMVGGAQKIKLGTACGMGNTVHEIGHALGLGHEQCRGDRDTYVTIVKANINPAAIGNFNKNPAKYSDNAAYDYGSIMHYGKDAFSINGQDTIVTAGGQKIGQRSALSAGDIKTIEDRYANEYKKRP